MPVMEVKILPLGTKTASVCDHVVNAVKTLQHRGLKHELTSMGTIMESASLDQLFEAAHDMHKAALSHVDRVVTFIELDERKDKPLTMECKLRSAKEKLGE